MTDQNKCLKHDQEIKEIRTEFSSFKTNVNDKLEDIMEKLREPIFTDKQIFSLILSLIVYLVLSVNYINGISARSLKNSENIEKTIATDEKILTLLREVREDVASIKGTK